MFRDAIVEWIIYNTQILRAKNTETKAKEKCGSLLDHPLPSNAKTTKKWATTTMIAMFFFFVLMGPIGVVQGFLGQSTIGDAYHRGSGPPAFGLVLNKKPWTTTARSFAASNNRFVYQGITQIPSSSSALWMAQRRGGRGRVPPKQEAKPPMNDEIQQTELRIVVPSAKGKDEPLGVMSRDEALAKAKELGGLDLILINANSDPPVCKIADYSKYRYQKEKKAKEVKKNSKASELKEVKMSYKIDTHDYDVRVKNASKFLSQGNRVKCTVMFRGREVQHDKLGVELLQRMAGDMTKIGTMEGKPKREGRNLSCIMTPRAEVIKAVNEVRRKEEKEKKKKKDAQKSAVQREKESEGVATEEKEGAGAEAAVLVQEEGETDNNGSIEDNSENDDDDDDDDDATLDELLGGDDLTDDLFS